MQPHEAGAITAPLDSIGQPLRGRNRLFLRDIFGVSYSVKVDYNRTDDYVEITAVAINIMGDWVSVETDQITDDEFEDEILEDVE